MFLWSVLNGRSEIAEIYWRKGHPLSRHHCIARALFACAVSRTISKSLMFKGSILDREKLENLASRFESISVEILDLCDRNNAAVALNVPLFQPWLSKCVWVDSNKDFLTPIGMAFTANAMQVVAHNSFQECLNKIWHGRLVQDLSREHSLSTDLFRGTLVQLPRLQRMANKRLGNFASILNTDAVDACVKLACAFIPPLILFLDMEQMEASFFEKAIHKLSAFYTAPCTKYLLEFCSYLSFVMFYTYVGFFIAKDYTGSELFMHLWILALCLAELRQIRYEGLHLWLQNGSNFLDLLMFSVYVPAFSLRMCELVEARIGSLHVDNDEFLTIEGQSSASYRHLGGDLTMARSWHAIAGIFFWIRTFYFLRVSSTLGPLWVVLIRVVCKDVFYFITFLIVFLASFGAAIICVERPTPDPDVSSWTYMAHMFYFPYMALFGEYFLDTQNYFTSHPGGPAESENRVAGTVLLCVYLFSSTIVLMNLLIARKYPRHPMFTRHHDLPAQQ